MLSAPLSLATGAARLAQLDAATTAFPAVVSTHDTVRVCTTGPQVAFHAPHAPADQVYTGQVASAPVSVIDGTARAAQNDALTVRLSPLVTLTHTSERERTTAPHVAFQAPHAPDDHAKTGQAASIAVSVLEGARLLAQKLFGTNAATEVRLTQVTTRVRTAAPHVAFHASQLPADHAYSGHASNTADSTVDGFDDATHHVLATVEFAAVQSTHDTLRDRTTGPHVAFQVPHADGDHT